jgi:hypothetical protein
MPVWDQAWQPIAVEDHMTISAFSIRKRDIVKTQNSTMVLNNYYWTLAPGALLPKLGSFSKDTRGKTPFERKLRLF